MICRPKFWASSPRIHVYREVVSQVLHLSIFRETRRMTELVNAREMVSLALTSSVIRPSGSFPLGLAYTGEDSVVHHALCSQQRYHENVAWWAIEQQRLFETLATPLVK